MNMAASIAIDALAYGMVLFVISIGLSVMLGLMKVVNLAHGSAAMIGGVLASLAIREVGLPYAAAVPAAVAATIALAWPLERLLFRRVYGSHEPLRQVLMTTGIMFCVIGVTNYAFSPTIKTIPLPAMLTGAVDLGFRSIPAHRILVIASGVLVASGLWFVIERTDFGMTLRASVDNPGMASALGIRTDRIYAACFALAVGLGAFGGIVGAEILPIEPFYALRYTVLFLVVVSVGGPGSIAGALSAALLLSLVDTTSRYLLPDFGEFFFYLAVVAVVLAFPNGLFGRAS